MLMPDERAQAIQILTTTVMNNSMHYSGQSIKDMLTLGFRGFANYSDKELLRAMQTLGKKTNSFEVQNFISTIAADKFVLE